MILDPADTDVDEIAALAAATFPLACPPTAPPEDIASFIAAQLSRERFAGYLADPCCTLLAARDRGRMVGYAMLVDGVGADSDVAGAVTLRPAVELSKIYVLADSHGSGVATALMDAALERAAAAGARCVWRRQPEKPTGATVLRKTRFHRRRHQNVPDGVAHRA